ncbi:MAG TPA: hypothetical protein VGT44_21480 [Ktedonobacteraceae bacterium]|nr:hypothetical protein [Ktedonobacteraceae bacterium]
MQTGKLGTGILAGFVAGLTSTIISSLVSLILTLPNLDALRQNLQQAANQQHVSITYTNSLVIEVLAISLLFSLVLGSLLALAGGAIGGYMGKGSALPPPQEEYREAMFVPPTQQPSEPEP